MVKTGALIQARTRSVRLPEKVLLDLPYKSGFTVIEQIVNRVKPVSLVNEIIVATSDQPWDNPIEKLCKEKGIKCFRGSEPDVLSRFYHCAVKFGFDVVIRLTADNPCIDAEIIEETLKSHINGNYDFTTTKNYPLGTNIEILSFKGIAESFKSTESDYDKEHITPYILKNRENYRVHTIQAPPELTNPDLRLTLDTQEDYTLLCSVFDCLYPANPFFSCEDIINLFKQKPWLKLINKNILQKKIFDTLEEEILEACNLLDLQDLKRAAGYLRSKKFRLD